MLYLLPALTGLLLVASFPRADQGYLAWIAFIPQAFFLLRVKSIKAAFGGGFLAGFLEFFALLIWMPPVLAHYGGLSQALAWLAYVLLIVLLACYPAAACAITGFGIRRCGASLVLVFPFIWVVVEYAQSISPFGGFPWLPAGYSQSRFLTLIQISDLTGVYGISFLIVWTCAAMALLLHLRGRGFLAWAPVCAAGLLITGCVIYGGISLKNWDRIQPEFSAALLQKNISYDEPEWASREKFQDGYVRMAERLTPGTDLVILPESPSPLRFESNPEYSQVIRNLAGHFRFGLIFNNIAFRGTEQKPQYFNSAYFLGRDGSLKGIYDKVHLVPFGEYIPLRRFFSFIDTVSKDVNEFDPGTGYPVISIGDHPANAIICFEAVFPNLVRRFVRRGSQLIINLTNDGWYGDSAAPYQHLAISRLRAVENRRYLLRATNSGISAFVEPTGRIQSSTGILREAICKGRFAFIGDETLYTRYGDVFVFLCAIISCGSMIWASLGIARRNERRA